jgi:transmembrane sensor
MKDIDKQYFRGLMRRYRRGDATPEEERLLESFYEVFDANEDLVTAENESTLEADLKQRIDARIAAERPVTRLWIRWAAAAAVLILIGAGAWYFSQPKIDQASVAKNRIEPGTNRATLQLANGSKIDLTAARNGLIARQAGISIHKNAKGLLVYTIAAPVAGAAGENTISTPRGGQYEVVLPDGTRVILNAASSLTYPVVFGAERKVTLTGEAYFEVAKDKAHPFKVSSAGQMVTVLGTHFNINAYSDEAATRTTLLEGSVEVSDGADKERIVPGEQALKQGDALIKHVVDVDKEVAWKNGLFAFNGDDLQTILRQISRWYNIEVMYVGPVTNEKFFGEIPRASKLDAVLKILELNNVHFTIEGRRLKVSN